MFTKLLNKLSPNAQKSPNESGTSAELNPRIIIHYGIPSNASRLAYDPIQHILAVGTLDGRIKVIASDSIEGLLISPKSLPFRNMEFLQNQGFLVSISNENDLLVWDLEHRCVASSLQWESNITAFSVIHGTSYMYIGDECGSVSVLKYNVEERELLQLPYKICSQSVSDSLGLTSLNNHSIVGVLSQPCSLGYRIMFAYDNGVIVLWDVSEDKMVLTRGYKDLHLKVKSEDDSGGTRLEQSNEASDDEQSEKEISSLCWASLDGSILAVGYVDGDIMLWDLRNNSPTKDHKHEKPGNSVFKLQISSAEKRFPVIVLNWCPGRLNKNNGNGGQLFAYGGDEIGTAEVLTILSLEWASGREALNSIARVDLTLHGSFSDMILLQNVDPKDSNEMASLFILTSSGQLQLYDDSGLLALLAHQDNASPYPVQYSCIIPTIEPRLTVGKLCLLPTDTECSKALMEMASSGRSQETHLQSNRTNKWPLCGGVPCHLPLSGEMTIERLYIAGYQDGSIRVWDATYPVLSPLFILESEIKGVSIPGSTASISALDFSSSTLSIAIGSESGLVRLYTLKSSCNETTLLHVTEKGSEAHVLDQGYGPYCSAVFSLCPSPVVTLRYTNLGDRLAIGYKSGHVAMLDISSLSVLFLTEAQQSVISFAMGTFPNAPHITVNNEQSKSTELSESAKELLFVLREDLHFSVLDSSIGGMICSHSICPGKESSAVSMYILDDGQSAIAASDGENLQQLSQNNEAKSESAETSDFSESRSVELGPEPSSKDAVVEKRPVNSQILFCLTNELQLYSLQSLFQENRTPICEVHLQNPICWTSTCMKDGKECRVVLLYQTGVIEIRSLPDLEVIREISLASIMRWNFQANMEKTMSCTHNGQIALVSGCEFAILSLLSFQNDSRILQSLPCLHDKTFAAAYSAHLASSNQKKNKETISGIFVGLVKGLRSSKDATVDPAEAQKVDSATLERLFFKLAPEPTASTGVVELSIDDIHIDVPLRIEPLHNQGKTNKNDEKKERDKLFEGGTSYTKPKQRSIEEIKAKYGRPGLGDAAAAAMEAKNKLLERQEKLERLTKNTEELQSGSENFASLAQELAKKMEKRRWWQL